MFLILEDVGPEAFPKFLKRPAAAKFCMVIKLDVMKIFTGLMRCLP